MRFLILFLCLISTSYANISSWHTPEGARVLFTQTSGLPMLDIALNFDAASSRDKDKFGLAALTSDLLATATKYQNEEQIISSFDEKGAQFSANSLKDMAIVSLRTLTRKDILKGALDTFTEVITKPSFEQKYLTREKKQTLVSIEAGKQSPSTIAANAFSNAVFRGHPYAHNKIGNEASIRNITIKDIKDFYKKHYVAKNLTIALVGDITRVKAKQIARQISHGLNIGKKPGANPKVKVLDKAQDIHIKFPSKQTHLLIGQTGISRSHPDYYALYLGNHIFGGSGLTSILSGEIREKKGLAYSAFSYFTKMTSDGYFLIKLQTKNNQKYEAKAIALQTFKDFLTMPITKQQLDDGKDNIIGGFALETASNSNILIYLSIIGFYDLPLDYLSSFTDKIKDISVSDIQNAFNKLIDADKLIILSVGKNVNNE